MSYNIICITYIKFDLKFSRMKNCIGFLFFCFLLMPIMTFAQGEKSLISKDDAQFSFEDKTYEKFKQMESIFQTDELSFKAFKKARKAEKNVYVWAGVSAGFTVLAVGAIGSANGNNTDNFDNAIGAVFGGTMAGITAIGAVLQKFKSNKKRKKAIETFNDRSLSYQPYLPQNQDMKVSLSGNVIVVTF